MNNIELFNIYTGKMFAYFYEHFPIAKSIVFADIVEEMRPVTHLTATSSEPEWRIHAVSRVAMRQIAGQQPAEEVRAN